MTSRNVSSALSALQAIFDHGPLVAVTGTTTTIKVATGADSA